MDGVDDAIPPIPRKPCMDGISPNFYSPRFVFLDFVRIFSSSVLLLCNHSLWNACPFSLSFLLVLLLSKSSVQLIYF